MSQREFQEEGAISSFKCCQAQEMELSDRVSTDWAAGSGGQQPGQHDHLGMSAGRNHMLVNRQMNRK